MKFDAYDFIGVIAPGVVLLVVIATLYPSLVPQMTASLSFGDFGLLLLLSFVTGHLVQAGGNLWEIIVWAPTRGMPTSWVSKKKTSLLSDNQLARLNDLLLRDFGCDRFNLSKKRSLLREIVVLVKRYGNTDRIEKFNQNYGLMRGLSVSLVVSLMLVLFETPTRWQALMLITILAGVSTYRMIQFGKHYARELYAEYLNVDRKPSASPVR